MITKIQEHGGQKYSTNQLSPPKVSVMEIRRNQSTFATKQKTYGDQVSFREKDYARLNLQDQMCYKICMCLEETCRNTTTLKLFLLHSWITRTLINDKKQTFQTQKYNKPQLSIGTKLLTTTRKIPKMYCQFLWWFGFANKQGMIIPALEKPYEVLR